MNHLKSQSRLLPNCSDSFAIAASHRQPSAFLLACSAVLGSLAWIGLLPSSVRACTQGALDYVAIGTSMPNVLNSFGLCGGGISLDRYSGRYGKGLVLCSPETRSSQGRRLLVINNKVVAIRNGVGNSTIGSCLWGQSYRGD